MTWSVWFAPRDARSTPCLEQEIGGTFTNLMEQQSVGVLAKVSKLQDWTAEIITNNYSCGAFIMITGGGTGRVSHQGMFIGPFQT